MMKTRTITERINYLCEVFSYGNIAHFARKLGWSYQYAYKLMNKETCGITPITELLMKFPQLNARWLITGEGVPFPELIENARNKTSVRLELMLRYEKYVKYMTDEQLKKYTDAAELFTPQEIAELDKKRQEETKELSYMLARADSKK